MIPIYIAIDKRIFKDGILSAAHWRDTLHAGMEYLAEFWFRVLLKKHFTVAGGKEYLYVPRKKGYLIAKARTWGHQLPIVWSGRMYRAMTSIFDRKITTNAQGSTAHVYLHPPSGAYMQTAQGPDLVAELESFSERDQIELTQRLAEFIENALFGEGQAPAPHVQMGQDPAGMPRMGERAREWKGSARWTQQSVSPTGRAGGGIRRSMAG
jgi:hypothetical protein